MKDISIYLSPYVCATNSIKNNSLGEIIVPYSSDLVLQDFKVALLGVEEDRGAVEHFGCALGAKFIRKQLYDLSNHFADGEIVDLGDIKAGSEVNDTYYAVAEVIKELVKLDVFVVILGGTQDLSYANYLAYEGLEQIINMASIDPEIDLEVFVDHLNERNYLHHIISHQPNYLFNYANIGFQSYFVSKEIWKLMDQMSFDAIRLGLVRQNLLDAEPYLRSADLISLDVASIKYCDMPASVKSRPNGFYGEEICQLAKYAGASEKLSSFGLYNYNPSLDQNKVGAMLCAQIIWYLLDGLFNRVGDYPLATKESLIKYIVQSPEYKEDLIFFKSKWSNRWWIELPHPNDVFSDYKRHFMVPCAYADYLAASNGEIPERLWQHIKKV